MAVIPLSSELGHLRPGALPFTSASLRERTALEHTLETLAGCGSIDDLVILTDERTRSQLDDRLVATPWSEVGVRCVPAARPGTEARSLLTHCAELASASGSSRVLIHWVTHALASARLVASVAEALGTGRDVVVPGVPVVDSIMAVDAEGVGVITGVVDRERVKVLQSPWGFSAETLAHVHELPPVPGTSPGTTDGSPGREFHELAHRLAERAGRDVAILPGEMQAGAMRSMVDVLRMEIFYEAGTAVRAL